MKNFFRESLSTVLTAVILSLILRAYVVEARVIPSGSMLPTIQLHDRVLVNKFIYNFTEPQRGDIIVFEPPESLGVKHDFIKRVIGLPGDVIEIRDGKVYVNGEPLKEPYIFEAPRYNFGPVKVPEDSLFVLGDNRNESFDSHVWRAWLKIEDVKGKAFYRYWPPQRIGLLH
ncbi:signal peptidase I [Calderihabitans maritimus]|nr:signal peptidase I [Calderihabitans maritimus]